MHSVNTTGRTDTFTVRPVLDVRLATHVAAGNFFRWFIEKMI